MTKSSTSPPDESSNQEVGVRPRAVVALGASAGGVTALQAVLGGIPADADIAVGVVLHMSAEGEDSLAAVLATACTLPVEQVTGPTPLRGGRVYVIPPAANLEVTERELRLSELSAERAERAPIDHFFRSVADVWGRRSVAVVLSGSGTDGALGIRAVKGAGGFTIAQDPNDADFDGMPQAAISTETVDLVLPVAQIAEAVLRITGSEPLVKSSDDADDDAVYGMLQAIFAQLRGRVGRDFTRYKQSTLLRRIERRMQIRGVREMAEYLELLRSDGGEVRALADDLLITVTRFFRDPEAFRCLQQDILPQILREHSAADDEVRVWSAGCASGEEAYSLAILLLEVAEATGSHARLQVFASDLHEPSLARARDGFYPAGIEADVDPDRLAKHFLAEDGGYRLRKEVRDLIVFAPHNLLGDPPFSRIDLVLCRNVLIYLQREAQRDLDSVFHYALRPGGFLMVGGSEAIVSQELFALEDKHSSVYRRRDVPTPERRLPLFPSWHGVAESGPSDREGPRPSSYPALHQQLLMRCGPPSLLLGPDDEVVNLSGDAGRYLVHPPGEFSATARRLIREELRVDLGSALSQARRAADGATTRTRPVKVSFDGEIALVSLCIRTSPERHDDGFLLVLFEEWELKESDRESPDASGGSLTVREKELQAEVELLRQRLQKVVDEYESGQEQMKASNEELQSANEELRSTMEELQTSKEELQSINEELNTVNQENRHKVQELAQLSADLQSLLAATDIAMLFLDTELRIVRFTPKVGELVNIRATDRGRPISDLTHRLGYPGLRDDAAKVLERLVSVEREVQDESGRSYYVRMLPYRMGAERIGGVVITIVDLTPIRVAEAALSQSEKRYRQLFEHMNEAFALCEMVYAEDGRPRDWRFVEVNQAWATQTGTDARVVGSSIRTIAPRVEDSWIEMVGAAVREGRPVHFEGFVADFGRWFEVHVFPHHGNRFGLLTFDCTERRENQQEQDRLLEQLREAEAQLRELDRQKDRFVAMLAHELRSPLAPLEYATRLLSQDAGSLDTVLPMIDTQVRHLTRLVNDLVSLAQVSRDGLSLSLGDDADLARAIHNAGKVVAERIADRRQELVLPPEEPVLLRADEMRLEQVMWNLIENASKYSGPGTTIAVSLEADAERVTVHVRDEGCGVDPADQRRIFEAFTRCKEGGPEGLGLGLPIVKHLVEAHGGEVGVESDGGGQGSTFFVRLPRSGAAMTDG